MEKDSPGSGGFTLREGPSFAADYGLSSFSVVGLYTGLFKFHLRIAWPGVDSRHEACIII